MYIVNLVLYTNIFRNRLKLFKVFNKIYKVNNFSKISLSANHLWQFMINN